MVKVITIRYEVPSKKTKHLIGTTVEEAVAKALLAGKLTTTDLVGIEGIDEEKVLDRSHLPLECGRIWVQIPGAPPL